MRLKKISWRNFKSYSNILTEIPFTNNSSLNLIIGENGTGKSSISEVITYTLYGKIDNIKNSDIPNRINKNFYSKIELDCDGHELIIERGLNPSIFEIHIDGKRIDTAGKTTVQQMIEENYLKIPYSVWINTVMLSINDFKSLISLNAADKRNIIDKIFGFTIYNQLGKLTKDELKGIESLMYETEGSLRTTPFPLIYTSILAVPKSIPISVPDISLSPFKTQQTKNIIYCHVYQSTHALKSMLCILSFYIHIPLYTYSKSFSKDFLFFYTFNHFLIFSQHFINICQFKPSVFPLSVFFMF